MYLYIELFTRDYIRLSGILDRLMSFRVMCQLFYIEIHRKNLENDFLP